MSDAERIYLSKKKKRFHYSLTIKHFDQSTVENVLEEFLDSWLGRSNYNLEDIVDLNADFDGDRN